MSILDMFKTKGSEECIEDCSVSELATARKDEEGEFNRVREALNRLRKIDAEAAEFYRAFEPPIKTETVGPRTFVRLGDQEFVAEFVTDISVASLGTAPQASVDEMSIYRHRDAWVRGARPAQIHANLVSGKTVQFCCNRHAVDAVYMALREAWLDALRLSEAPSEKVAKRDERTESDG